MFAKKKQVLCPVGNHAELGFRTPGMATTVICKECGFSWPVDADGKFGAPAKWTEKKPPQKCGCGGCADVGYMRITDRDGGPSEQPDEPF